MNLKKKGELIKQVSSILDSLSVEEKREILDGVLMGKERGMPISVFKAGISGLEIITKYLREVENRSFKEISRILNRRLSTLYNTYNKSRIKFKDKLDVSDKSISIPFDIFKNRRYSVLESIVVYLKDKEKLSFNQISLLLNKNYNTVKTVYRRFRIKKMSKKK